MTTYYTNRGNLLYENRQLDEAIELYSKGIALFPNDDEAFFNRANVYYDMKELDRAIVDFNRAIEINSNKAEYYNNRGVAFYDKNELDKALDDYNKAIEINPDYTLAKENKEEACRIIESRNKINGVKEDKVTEVSVNFSKASKSDSTQNELLDDNYQNKIETLISETTKLNSTLQNLTEINPFPEATKSDEKIIKEIAHHELYNMAIAIEELRDIFKDNFNPIRASAIIDRIPGSIPKYTKNEVGRLYIIEDVDKFWIYPIFNAPKSDIEYTKTFDLFANGNIITDVIPATCLKTDFGWKLEKRGAVAYTRDDKYSHQITTTKFYNFALLYEKAQKAFQEKYQPINVSPNVGRTSIFEENAEGVFYIINDREEFWLYPHFQISLEEILKANSFHKSGRGELITEIEPAKCQKLLTGDWELVEQYKGEIKLGTKPLIDAYNYALSSKNEKTQQDFIKNKKAKTVLFNIAYGINNSKTKDYIKTEGYFEDNPNGNFIIVEDISKSYVLPNFNFDIAQFEKINMIFDLPMNELSVSKNWFLKTAAEVEQIKLGQWRLIKSGEIGCALTFADYCHMIKKTSEKVSRFKVEINNLIETIHQKRAIEEQEIHNSLNDTITKKDKVIKTLKEEKNSIKKKKFKLSKLLYALTTLFIIAIVIIYFLSRSVNESKQLIANSGKPKTKTITMINLQNKPIIDAVNFIKNNNLALGTIDSTYDDVVDKRKIVKFTPYAGAELLPGTTVNLSFSCGQKTCPDCRRLRNRIVTRDWGAKRCGVCGYKFDTR